MIFGDLQYLVIFVIILVIFIMWSHTIKTMSEISTWKKSTFIVRKQCIVNIVNQSVTLLFKVTACCLQEKESRRTVVKDSSCVVST